MIFHVSVVERTFLTISFCRPDRVHTLEAPRDFHPQIFCALYNGHLTTFYLKGIFSYEQCKLAALEFGWRGKFRYMYQRKGDFFFFAIGHFEHSKTYSTCNVIYSTTKWLTISYCKSLILTKVSAFPRGIKCYLWFSFQAMKFK